MRQTLRCVITHAARSIKCWCPRRGASGGGLCALLGTTFQRATHFETQTLEACLAASVRKQEDTEKELLQTKACV